MKENYIYSWGFSKYGQCGDFRQNYLILPNEIKLIKKNKENDNDFLTNPNYLNLNFKENEEIILEPDSIFCGEFHSGIISNTKELFMFGKNNNGQLGTGDNINSCFPRFINLNNIKIKLLALGGEHTVALSTNSIVFSWGLNIYGQLGSGNFYNYRKPNQIIDFCKFNKIDSNLNEYILENEQIIEISAGAQHTLLLSNKNNLFSCGSNFYNSLGHNSINIEKYEFGLNKFTLIEDDLLNGHDKINKISCGWYYSGCICNNNLIIIWGMNLSNPTIIKNNEDIKEIINFQIGLIYIAFLSNEGHVFIFEETNLVNKNLIRQIEFKKIKFIDKIINISVGSNFILALNNKGKLYGLGNNKFNQLLLFDGEEKINSPVDINLLSDLKIIKITAGGYHSIILCEKKSIKSINPIKVIPINRALNVSYIDTHLKQINNIINYQETLRENINKKILEINKLQSSINNLKAIFNEIPCQISNSHQKENINLKFQILKELEEFSFDEEIKLNELIILDKVNIGDGTFGEVKKCLYKNTIVAVKFLIKNSDQIIHLSNIKLFIEEFNILKKLRHPNIILYLGACFTSPEYFLVTEYCKNGSLYNFLHDLNNKTSIKDSTKIKWALEIARSINYLHSFNPPIIHRDLKSLNILLDHCNQIKIADFGWARLKEQHMTKQRGTFQWMAPEVVKNGEYSEKADVYSYGIILWEIYSQSKPYENISNIDVAKKVVEDPNFRPPINNDISLKIAKLIVSCWQYDEKARPNFEQIIDYLESYKNNK